MREALEEIICAHPATSTMRQVHAIVAGRNALTAANAVQPQAQAEAIAWVLEWTFNGEEKGRRLYDDETHCKFDAEQDGGVCRPLVYGDAAHPQATEPAGWTGKTDIDAALIMLDRLDVQGEGDDARVDEILRTLRKLAAAPEAKQ
jgi:hypothetical protein